MPAELLLRRVEVSRRRGIDLAERPLAWISTRRHAEEETTPQEGWELEVALWPSHGPRLTARLGNHGQWLEWLG